MPTPLNNKATRQLHQKAIEWAKDYFFRSSDRYKAFALLISLLLLMVALVWLMSALSWGITGFFDALMDMDLPLFIENTKVVLALVLGFAAVNTLNDYCFRMLNNNWRKWLTEKLVEKYTLGKRNHLDVARSPDNIDNPAQRILDDVSSFVEYTLSLGLDFIKSVASLVTFVGVLWVVGGAFSGVIGGISFTIPGFLVWVALAFSAIASFITYKIGRSLTDLSNHEQRISAGWRSVALSLDSDAETIALEGGARYYHRVLLHEFKTLLNNAYETLRVKIRLIAFQSFYAEIANIFPYIAAAPMYFAGYTTAGQLMQIGFAFSQVQSALNWFVESYETFALWKTSLTRLSELDTVLTPTDEVPHKNKITHKKQANDNQIVIERLNIAKPNSTDFILLGLNLTFKSGENTLIGGVSGLGKSTLLKVLKGTWLNGDGTITLPGHKSLFFMPQTPTLPDDTLKGVLAYPDEPERYTDEACQNALTAVGGDMNEFSRELHHNDTWSQRLSGGQRKRIAFARALLQKPDWLFLDEATASLDADSERDIYQLLKRNLPATTIVSISHQPSVEQFHDRIVTFRALDKTREIHITDRRRDALAANDDVLERESIRLPL